MQLLVVKTIALSVCLGTYYFLFLAPAFLLSYSNRDKLATMGIESIYLENQFACGPIFEQKVTTKLQFLQVSKEKIGYWKLFTSVGQSVSNHVVQIVTVY